MKTSNVVPKAERIGPRRRRRQNSAKDGDAFFTILDIMGRWGVVRRTAKARIREAKIAAYNFSDQCVRYRVEDVVRYEESLRA